MLLAISQRPTYLRRKGFRPPSIQLRQIDATIDEHFHAARTASLPGTARGVDPDVHALHQLLGQAHVVVTKENHMGTDLWLADEVYPFMDQCLSRLVLRMGLAGDHELYRDAVDWSTIEAAAAGHAAAGLVSCRSRSGAQNPASMRWDQTDVSPCQPSRATSRKRPVAGTIARERIQPETCWRQCEISRARSREPAECLVADYSLSPASGPFRSFRSKDRRPAAESHVGM